jgi:hypothetical protein
MAGMSASAPRDRQRLPEATLSLVALAYSELRGDVRRLLVSRWDEPVRRRAEELSTALDGACRRQDCPDLARLFRSVTNLARLSRADALLVLPALREKFELLMKDIEAFLPRWSDRSCG